MKKFCFALFFCFLIFSPQNAATEDFNFGWSLGNIWFYYEPSQNYVSLDYSILHFNWLLYDKFIMAFDTLQIQSSPVDNEYFRILILPLEAAFIPLSFNIGRNHQLCFSVNSRMSWQLTTHKEPEKDSHAFFGSIGTELFLQLRMPESRMPYSRYLALFADYNIHRELKFGVRVDLTSVLLGLIWFSLTE